MNNPLSSVININAINNGNWLIMQLIKDKIKLDEIKKERLLQSLL